MVQSAIVFFILFTTYANYVEGLKCYTCSYMEGELDETCLTNPEQIKDAAQKCINNQNYCTITRVEWQKPKGKVQSFVRMCQLDPLFKNQDFEDFTFHTYFRACQTDLCNVGNGKNTPSIGGRDDNEEILLVPGIGWDNSALQTSCNFLFISAIATATLLYNF